PTCQLGPAIASIGRREGVGLERIRQGEPPHTALRDLDGEGTTRDLTTIEAPIEPQRAIRREMQLRRLTVGDRRTPDLEVCHHAHPALSGLSEHHWRNSATFFSCSSRVVANFVSPESRSTVVKYSQSPLSGCIAA